MILNLLETWSTPDEEIVHTIARLVNIVEITPNNVRRAANILNTTARLSLVVLSQFQVENCLRRVSEILAIDVQSRAFHSIAAAVLQNLELPVKLLDQLNVPALIRNSLHANGIHHGYQGGDTVAEIDGVTFEFLDGAPVDCANWQHIGHALENSIVILGLVFQCQPIRNLQDPITDPFSASLD